MRKVHALAATTDPRTICGRDRDDPEVGAWIDLTTHPAGGIDVTCGGCLADRDRHATCPTCGRYVPLRRDGLLAQHTRALGAVCPNQTPPPEETP